MRDGRKSTNKMPISIFLCFKCEILMFTITLYLSLSLFSSSSSSLARSHVTTDDQLIGQKTIRIGLEKNTKCSIPA